MRRSGVRTMCGLIGLVVPLLPVMALAVAMGVAGYLCAIFLTVAAAGGLLGAIGHSLPPVFAISGGTMGGLFAVMGGMAVLRGVFHYLEQDCNHYIAFKILALIRHRVFASLRRLCPAKLEGKERGNLISVITSDIELLEVFYAHTISPVAIAAVTSLLMVLFIGAFHPLCGMLAFLGYAAVGVVLPIWNGKRSAGAGMEYRKEFGSMNSFVLDSLRGLREIIQYGQEAKRLEGLEEGSERLSEKQGELKRFEGGSAAALSFCITFFSFAMFFLTIWLYETGRIGFVEMLLATVAMMSSFGPVTALLNLSNQLNQTLACGERVLAVLEESPQVEEVSGKEKTTFLGAGLERVEFSYGGEKILDQVTMDIPKNKILGIHGKSGSGKSTVLKLLMRFWDVQGGRAAISNRDVREINTDDLRGMEGFVTQETALFHDSIAANIGIGKPGATREEIVEAAKKASIHAFIEGLPKGYDTPVGELGDTLSGGERQRIGIARAFLHDAPFLLLDEPTSNLDSLNEGIILKSLYEERDGKTVVLVSHRPSTMKIADYVYEMNEARDS